jgi:ribonuclease Z
MIVHNNVPESDEIADSLFVKKMFWTRSMQIPGTSWTIRGYSRSAWRTGFYIKDLDILLDAGPQNFNLPSHIFITHSHGDHIAALPFTLIGYPEETVVQIFGPSKAKPFIEEYIDKLFTTNDMSQPTPRNVIDGYYMYRPKNAYETFDVTCNNTPLIVEVFKCDHCIPTISYGFSEQKRKLKPEYLSLTGKEIGKLRMEGCEVTEVLPFKRFAYVCDTTMTVFDANPSLLEYPVIFIECTFLYEDEYEMSKGKKHIHWKDLKPVTINNRNTKFVLFHFSQRYKDAEIREFFESQNLDNVVAWA